LERELKRIDDPDRRGFPERRRDHQRQRTPLPHKTEQVIRRKGASGIAKGIFLGGFIAIGLVAGFSILRRYVLRHYKRRRSDDMQVGF
jgi:hypothetical protein